MKLANDINWFRDEIAHDDPNGDCHKRLRAKVISTEIRIGVPFMCGFCLLVIALVKAIIFDCLAFCHAVLEILIDIVGQHHTKQKGKINALVICIFLKSLLLVAINSNQTRGDYSTCHVILSNKRQIHFFSIRFRWMDKNIVCAHTTSMAFVCSCSGTLKNTISLWLLRSIMCFRILNSTCQAKQIGIEEFSATNTNYVACKWSTFWLLHTAKLYTR